MLFRSENKKYERLVIITSDGKVGVIDPITKLLNISSLQSASGNKIKIIFATVNGKKVIVGNSLNEVVMYTFDDVVSIESRQLFAKANNGKGAIFVDDSIWVPDENEGFHRTTKEKIDQ